MERKLSQELFRDRTLLFFVLIVLALVAVLLANTANFSDLKAADWAAWVGALGTVFAVVASVWTVRRQQIYQEYTRAQELLTLTKQRLETASQLLDICSELARKVAMAAHRLVAPQLEDYLSEGKALFHAISSISPLEFDDKAFTVPIVRSGIALAAICAHLESVAGTIRTGSSSPPNLRDSVIGRDEEIERYAALFRRAIVKRFDPQNVDWSPSGDLRWTTRLGVHGETYKQWDISSEVRGERGSGPYFGLFRATSPAYRPVPGVLPELIPVPTLFQTEEHASAAAHAAAKAYVDSQLT